jgi:hypothetical protein
MLGDDATLDEGSDAKTLTVKLDARKFHAWTTSASPHVLLSIECSDPRASVELGLVLLQWVSRSSRRPLQGFPEAPRGKKKRADK